MTPPPPGGATATPLGSFFPSQFPGHEPEYECYDRAARSTRRRPPHDGGADGGRRRHRAGHGAAAPPLRDGRHALAPGPPEAKASMTAAASAWRIGTGESQVIQTCAPCWSIAATMPACSNLSDPYWFGLATLDYLKSWQAHSDVPHVTAWRSRRWTTAWRRGRWPDRSPRIGSRSATMARLRSVPWISRSTSGWGAARPVLGRDRRHRPLRGQWHTSDLTLPTLAGGNTAAGPFGAVVDVSALSGRAIRGHRVGRSPRDPDGRQRARRYGWRRSKRPAELPRFGDRATGAQPGPCGTAVGPRPFLRNQNLPATAQLRA